MKTMKQALLISLGWLSLNVAIASPVPHTWHTVKSMNGTWNAKLQMLNQCGSFVARDGSSLTNFTIDPASAKDYGFIFDDNADFDVAYTLTLTERASKESAHFTSKTCVYVVTATGPAKPDIHVIPYNGAKCDWKIVHGVGEDFTVS